MTALLVLGVVNNDKRDTLSLKLQVGLPALEERIKKERNSTGKDLLLLLQNLALQHFNSKKLKCSWSSCWCSFSPAL